VFQTYSKNIEIRHEIVDDLPKIVLGDPTQLRQINSKLTGNAIKFTHKGDASLILDRDRNHLRIRVLDTGIGIPSALQGKLLEPYVHDVDTARKYGGSGLGLAIVKRLSDTMSVNVSFQSTPDEETCFTLILPLVEASPEQAQALLKSKDELPLWLPTLAILVVNANAVNRMVLAKTLEKNKHNLVSVTNGLETIEYANSHSLDIILLDIQMPEMDGLTAAQTIRTGARKSSSVPIIAITANLAKAGRSNALSAGMNDFISKPFRYEELVTLISSNLKGNRKATR